MAIEERFTAIISARNLAGATLRQVGAQFAALSRQTGLTRIASAAAGVGRAFANLATQVGSVVGPMAALGAAAGAAGLSSLAVRTAAAGDDLGDLSARTGVAIETLQSLSEVASRAGVDQAGLAGALQKLNRGLAEAANGGTGDLAPALRQLGISMRDANGEIRNAADLLPELADAFARNENQALRTRLATELFGRTGEQLIPMLAEGSAALREGQERFRRYGYSLAPVAEALSEADGQFKDMALSVRGLADAIGAQLAPVLGPIAARMADWVAANRELISSRVGEWAERASASFAAFFADRGPLDRLEGFASAIGSVVEAVGGVQNLMIGFGVLAVAPFLAALVSIAAAFGPLLAALGSLALALGAGSPAGLAILAFAGLAALLISNWRPVADFFRGLWADITAIFDAAWARLQPVVEAISAAMAPLRAGSSPTGPVASPEAQAQRRANQRAGGAQFIEGFNTLPQPAQAAAALAAPAQQGRVEVEVNVNNLPAGSRVEATSEGALVQQPRTSVGFALGRPAR
jgi:TP901 family phage tail tape measure protein